MLSLSLHLARASLFEPDELRSPIHSFSFCAHFIVHVAFSTFAPPTFLHSFPNDFISCTPVFTVLHSHCYWVGKLSFTFVSLCGALFFRHEWTLVRLSITCPLSTSDHFLFVFMKSHTFLYRLSSPPLLITPSPSIFRSGIPHH